MPACRTNSFPESVRFKLKHSTHLNILTGILKERTEREREREREKGERREGKRERKTREAKRLKERKRVSYKSWLVEVSWTPHAVRRTPVQK